MIAPAPAAAASAAVPADLAPLIRRAAEANGLDPALLAAPAWAESGFDSAARSHAGARGLTQLMPATAHALGVTDPDDPAQSLDAGARHLRAQPEAFGGDLALGLASYEAGREAVQRHDGVPPYSGIRAYVWRVLDRYDEFRSAMPDGRRQEGRC